MARGILVGTGHTQLRFAVSVPHDDLSLSVPGFPPIIRQNDFDARLIRLLSMEIDYGQLPGCHLHGTVGLTEYACRLGFRPVSSGRVADITVDIEEFAEGGVARPVHPQVSAVRQRSDVAMRERTILGPALCNDLHVAPGSPLIAREHDIAHDIEFFGLIGGPRLEQQHPTPIIQHDDWARQGRLGTRPLGWKLTQKRFASGVAAVT